MYNYIDSMPFAFTSVVYFCSLVTIGAFILLNLVLAQIMDTYTHNVRSREQDKQQELVQEDLNAIFARKLAEKDILSDFSSKESELPSFASSKNSKVVSNS